MKYSPQILKNKNIFKRHKYSSPNTLNTNNFRHSGKRYVPKTSGSSTDEILQGSGTASETVLQKGILEFVV